MIFFQRPLGGGTRKRTMRPIRVAGRASPFFLVILGGLLILGLGVGLAVFGGVGQVNTGAVNELEWARDREGVIQGVGQGVVGQVAADFNQFGQAPTGAGLAVSAGVLVESLGVRLFLVIVADLTDGLPAG